MSDEPEGVAASRGGGLGGRMPRRKKGAAASVAPRAVGGVLDREERKVLSAQLVTAGIERRLKEAKLAEQKRLEARRAVL